MKVACFILLAACITEKQTPLFTNVTPNQPNGLVVVNTGYGPLECQPGGTLSLGRRQVTGAFATPPRPTTPPVSSMAPPAPTSTNSAPADTTSDANSVTTDVVGTTEAGNDTEPTLIPDENCTDARDDCRTFGPEGCVGIYASWAQANCPRYCKYCIHPNDTNVECKNNIDNCNEYQSDMCTNPRFRIFAEDNCKLYCNLCDAGPKPNFVSTTAPGPITGDPTGNNGTCVDTVDYCWDEPDVNCFGVYEPWAKAHCPFRCGFCDAKPECKDELAYCSQYDASSCTDDSFQGWARKNCRKTCNLCALPTRPPNQPGVTNPDGQGAPTNVVPVSPSSQSPTLPTNNTYLNPGIQLIDGASVLGNKATFIIEGPPPKIPGTCLYKGDTHAQDKNWFDGCDYVCNCFDSSKNRIICTERCIHWGTLPSSLGGCSLVNEPGDCCQRLECNVQNI